MCGVTGLFATRKETIDENLLRRMTRSLRHRGPDDEALWTHERFGLGHTRLSIVDIAHGQQPFWDMSGRVVVICNGEIYNHEALRQELMQDGIRLKTRCDVEVLPHLYVKYGLDFASQLNGMFAIAVVDLEHEKLILVRDQAGIKPLYYGEYAGVWRFASELKAILQDQTFPRVINATALHDFLSLSYFLPPATFFHGIAEVMPSTAIVLSAQGISEHTWHCRILSEGDPSDSPIDRFDSIFHHAVQRHLMADVPICSFLSGGIDSSLITAFASSLSNVPIHTIHTSFTSKQYDESSFADAVAKQYGTQHSHVSIADQHGDFDQLLATIHHLDQPFGDTSSIPMDLMCKEVARHHKVALSGDGGDELFYGYRSFQIARALSWIKRGKPLSTSMLRTAASVLKPWFAGKSRQLKKLADFGEMPALAQVLALKTYFDETTKAQWYTNDWGKNALPRSTVSHISTVFQQPGDVLENMDAFNWRYALNADMLRKVDTMSMRHGLEVRVPFLDASCVSFSKGLPRKWKLRGSTGKWILRQLAKSYLPPTVIAHRKHGFDMPLDTWVNKNFISRTRVFLTGHDAIIPSIFKHERLTALLDRFEALTDDAEQSRYQNYQQLFMLLGIETSLQQWNCSVSENARLSA